MKISGNENLIKQINEWAKANWMYYRTIDKIMDAILNKFDPKGNLSDEEEKLIIDSVSDLY